MIRDVDRMQIKHAAAIGVADRLVLADALEIEGDVVRAAWWRTELYPNSGSSRGDGYGDGSGYGIGSGDGDSRGSGSGDGNGTG